MREIISNFVPDIKATVALLEVLIRQIRKLPKRMTAKVHCSIGVEQGRW